jgi:hypothetical protein
VNMRRSRTVDYDVAQRRMEARERNRDLFLFSLMLTVVLIWLSLGSGQSANCMVPIIALVGLITTAKGIQVYYESPHRLPTAKLTEQEMCWLYGEDWANTTSIEEYTFAQDRIRKRRIGRWIFVLHLLVFFPINGFILYLASGITHYDEPSGKWLFGIPALWFIFLLWKAWQAFPTAAMLERRERKAGEAIELEIEALRLDKQKRGEKGKRSTHVVLSDDGELLEVPETTDTADAKSRREIG